MPGLAVPAVAALVGAWLLAGLAPPGPLDAAAPVRAAVAGGATKPTPAAASSGTAQ